MAVGNSDGSIVLTTEVDEGGIEKFKSGIGNVGAVFAKIAAAGAAAFAGVATMATKSFADYEQLVGGVETLFKSSSDEVRAYADNAYKSAGLSANEYMETVTGFSASLLQSLGGDTEKSAQYANQAVVDMSDNANKMGSSMESIQNAYQGFAKQNYTMLDNLKLGYGGTKEEMQRLLDDAGKISGIKYDISSFADVTEAIHVIQTEMGITGTTALEAEQTISGSANMMKASWQNMLTGFADPSQNMGALLENFVGSVATFAQNLMPVIENSANSIIEVLPSVLEQAVALIGAMLPSVIEAVTGIIGGIVAVFPNLITSLAELLPQIITEILNLLPSIVQAGLDIILALAQGIADSLPALVPTVVDVVLQICQTLIDNLDQLVFAAIDIIVALATGIIDAIPTLLERLPEIITSIVMALTNPAMLMKLIEASILLMASLTEGLIKSVPAIIVGIARVVPAMVEGFEGYIEDFKQIGKHLIDGLWQGIVNTKDWLLNKIKAFAKSITDGIKSFFGIHSPSRVMRDEVGKNLMLGMAEGISQNGSVAAMAMMRVAKGLANTSFTMPQIVSGTVAPYFVNAVGAQDIERKTTAPQSQGTQQVVKEEIYNLNQTELMRVVYKLAKSGERLSGTSLLNGGAY